MTKNKWSKLIWANLEALGTNDAAFDPVVATLAAILEQRDKTGKEVHASGGHPVVEHTNKGGSTNMTKNPLLVLWDDLNKSALAYWRELGLTPSSYKKMTGASPKADTGGGLLEALKAIEEN